LKFLLIFIYLLLLYLAKTVSNKSINKANLLYLPEDWGWTLIPKPCSQSSSPEIYHQTYVFILCHGKLFLIPTESPDNSFFLLFILYSGKSVSGTFHFYFTDKNLIEMRISLWCQWKHCNKEKLQDHWSCHVACCIW
jgi:hypothetical protein